MVWFQNTAKKKLTGCEFLEMFGAVVFFSQFCPPQTSAHLPYQRDVYSTVLNLHFHQKMQDLQVGYHQALPLNQYQHTVLQHHPVHMLNQLINMCASKILPEWLHFTAIYKVWAWNQKETLSVKESATANYNLLWELRFSLFAPPPHIYYQVWKAFPTVKTWRRKEKKNISDQWVQNTEKLLEVIRAAVYKRKMSYRNKVFI